MGGNFKRGWKYTGQIKIENLAISRYKTEQLKIGVFYKYSMSIPKKRNFVRVDTL